MKRILTSLIVAAAVAALSAGAAFANDHHGWNSGDTTTVTVDPSATDNSSTDPTNSSSASNTGSNTSTQTVALSQTTAAISRIFLQIAGGAGAAGAPSGAATQTNSSGGNTANPGDEVEHAGNNSGDNSAGGRVVSVGGDGGSGGSATGAVTIAPVTSSGNTSGIAQVSTQKIVVLAPAIQKVSSDFNAFTLKLLGLGLLGPV